MSCITAIQESAILGVHFITKFSKSKNYFEQMIERLLHNQKYDYSTKLTYAFYQYYTLTRFAMVEDLNHTKLLQVLNLYNDLETGGEDDWFIECLKVMLYEKYYNCLEKSDDCIASIRKMFKLQQSSLDNKPEFIVTYIFQAKIYYQGNQNEMAVTCLKEGMAFCQNEKIKTLLHGHFKDILDRFIYLITQENQQQISKLLKELEIIYF